MKNIFSRKGLNIATGLVKPKTTCLFFDKIWIPHMENIFFDDSVPKKLLYIPPNSLQYAEFRRRFQIDTMSNSRYCNPDKKFEFLCVENSSLSLSDANKKLNYNNIEFITSTHRNEGIRIFTQNMKDKYGVDIIPIYIDKTAFEEDFKSEEVHQFNNNHPIAVAMDNIPMIIENKLDWKQVIEFKKDKKSVKRLQNFRTWTESELSGCPKSQIESIYEQALDDYISALKKHGILTTMGAISVILNSSAMILENINNDVYSKLAAGITVTTGLTVFTLNQCCEYYSTVNRPIAYIYDILKI